MGPPCSGWLMGWSKGQSCRVAIGVVRELGAPPSVKLPALVPGPSSYSTAANAIGISPGPAWTNNPLAGTSGGPGTATGTATGAPARLGLVTVHQPWSL